MRRNPLYRSATVPAVGAFLLAIGTHTGQQPLAAAGNPRWEFLVTNLDVFPGTEKLFDPDDELFWRLRPNLRGVKVSERLPGAEYPFSVSTDSDRRRRTPKVKSPDKTVLFLGDSCTFGIPVDDDESLPWRVQQQITKSHAIKIRAINAAVPGYSAFQGRLVLEQWKEKPAPDAVVITFWPNGRNIWDHLSDAEHKELLAAEREGEFSRHRLTRLLRRVTPGTRPRLNDEEFAGEIRAMVEWCRSRGAIPIVQVWPHQSQALEDRPIERQQALRRVGKELGVIVVDLVPRFRSQPVLFVDSIHLTKQGYARAAETLVPVLAKALGSETTAGTE